MVPAFDISPTDAELEALWRKLHVQWVAVSEALARANAQPRDEFAIVDLLRAQERQCRGILEQFERRMLAFRSRTAAYPHRYQ